MLLLFSNEGRCEGRNSIPTPQIQQRKPGIRSGHRNEGICLATDEATEAEYRRKEPETITNKQFSCGEPGYSSRERIRRTVGVSDGVRG